MTFIQVTNTKEIPGASFRAVQALNDSQAETALTAIAKRIGVTFEIVYRWGTPKNQYYYAQVPVRAESEQ